MIWQHMDFIINIYVEKMRYPEIHKNKLSQYNYSFFDKHGTNLIQQNNQMALLESFYQVLCSDLLFLYI